MMIVGRTNDLELIKAVRQILTSDNVDPNSPDELCIHSFVEDRITDVYTANTNITLPKIIVNVITENNIDSNLPAEHGMLNIKVVFNSSSNNSTSLSL